MERSSPSSIIKDTQNQMKSKNSFIQICCWLDNKLCYKLIQTEKKLLMPDKKQDSQIIWSNNSTR